MLCSSNNTHTHTRRQSKHEKDISYIVVVVINNTRHVFTLLWRCNHFHVVISFVTCERYFYFAWHGLPWMLHIVSMHSRDIVSMRVFCVMKWRCMWHCTNGIFELKPNVVGLSMNSKMGTRDFKSRLLVPRRYSSEMFTSGRLICLFNHRVYGYRRGRYMLPFNLNNCILIADELIVRVDTSYRLL